MKANYKLILLMMIVSPSLSKAAVLEAGMGNDPSRANIFMLGNGIVTGASAYFHWIHSDPILFLDINPQKPLVITNEIESKVRAHAYLRNKGEQVMIRTLPIGATADNSLTKEQIEKLQKDVQRKYVFTRGEESADAFEKKVADKLRELRTKNVRLKSVQAGSMRYLTSPGLRAMRAGSFVVSFLSAGFLPLSVMGQEIDTCKKGVKCEGKNSKSLKDLEVGPHDHSDADSSLRSKANSAE
jgi:hypothetical protein